MKPHPRIRRTIKWGGAAVTVLLVAVWIGSGWFEIKCEKRARGTLLGQGRIAIHEHGQTDIPPRPEMQVWGTRSSTFHLQWMQFDWLNNKYGRHLIVPLWVPVVPLLLIVGAAWRFDTLARRRARLNLCAECGYDRAGLAAGAVCPECGAAST